MTGATGGMGLVMLGSLIFATAALILFSRLSGPLKLALLVGLFFRLVGSGIRFEILWEAYGGVGDAVGYYGTGLQYAERFLQFDFSPILDSSEWWAGRFWGTHFVRVLSGMTLVVLGPGVLAEFLAFGLLSYLGLVCILIAFHRQFPHVPPHRYAWWLFLVPSLWFWPASVGKEAVVLFGLGLAVLGFAGNRGKVSWTPLLIGLGSILLVRPQLAALTAIACFAGHWATTRAGPKLRSVGEGFVILVVAGGAVWLGRGFLGIETIDPEGIEGYIGSFKGRRLEGGSAIEAVEIGWTGVPAALINVLFRPFPWEISNPLDLVAGLEIYLLWMIILYRHSSFIRALRGWRRNRLVLFSVVFVITYAVGLGLMATNVGLIARQRIFLLPFLLLLIEGGAVPKGRRRPSDTKNPPTPSYEPATVRAR